MLPLQFFCLTNEQFQKRKWMWIGNWDSIFNSVFFIQHLVCCFFTFSVQGMSNIIKQLKQKQKTKTY